MKFLCDVHISYKIVQHLKSIGYDSIHVNDILNSSKTKDSEICKYADDFNFVLITKDLDFRNSFFIKKTPKKLIKINLGNISNDKLKSIFTLHIEFIEKLDSRKMFLCDIDMDDLSVIDFETE